MCFHDIGGVGKSTLSANVVAAYAKSFPQKKILFVDLTLTKSIARLLLGDASPKLTLDVVEHMCRQKVHRTRAFIITLVSSPATAMLAYVGGPLGAVMFVMYALCMLLYYRKKVARKVNPMEFASMSTHSKNLGVLVGGESLARASKGFDWKIAAGEWTVPADVDVVVFDVDNVLDDFARFAFSVSDGVVVPSTLNMFDFERLCVDPRNNALFDFLREMPAGKRPKVSGVVFNRVKCVANAKKDEIEDDVADEFDISASDKSLRDGVEARFEEKVHVGRYAMVREMPPSVMNAMFDQRKPVCMLSASSHMGTALEGAKDNFSRVAKKIFV